MEMVNRSNKSKLKLNKSRKNKLMTMLKTNQTKKLMRLRNRMVLTTNQAINRTKINQAKVKHQHKKAKKIKTTKIIKIPIKVRVKKKYKIMITRITKKMIFHTQMMGVKMKNMIIRRKMMKIRTIVRKKKTKLQEIVMRILMTKNQTTSILTTFLI